MFELFTTREIATAVWLILLLFYILYKQKTREALKKVCKAALKPKLAIPAIIICGIGLGLSYVASQYSFWDNAYYKDVVMWILFVGLPLCFGAISSKESDYFKNAIADNLKLTVLFECIYSTFTYSLFAELLIIPCVTFLAMMQVVAEREEKHKAVAKLLKVVFAIIGLTTLFFTTKHAIEEFQMDMTTGMLASLIIPLTLSILYVPLAYILALYSKYELAFLRMRFCEPKNRWIRIKHRLKALAVCNLSLRKTTLLSQNSAKYMYISMPEQKFNEFLLAIRDKNKWNTL